MGNNSSSSTTVIVAEPSLGECRAIKHELSLNGYSVFVVHDEYEIAPLMRFQAPDVLVIGSDFNGKKGDIIVAELLSDSSLADFYPVMISSESDPALIREIFRRGVRHLVPSPVDGEQLSALIKRNVGVAKISSGKNVLAVSGDPDFLRKVVSSLGASGHKVVEANCARDGLKASIEGTFELAFIDAELPEMAGVDFVGMLKGAEKTKNIEIVMMGPPAPDDSDQKTGQPGIVERLDKAISADELRNFADAWFTAKIMTSRTREKIMAVEDSKIVGKLYSHTLSKNNFDYRIVENPAKAIEVMLEFDPDLVLMDANMPGISGFELTRMIKGMPEFASTRIIMVTSDRKKKSVIEALESGAADFMNKPFDEEILLARMRVHLNGKKLFDDLNAAYARLDILNKRLERLYVTDGLTGLYNHQHFHELMSREIRTAGISDKPLSLIFADIDHFKKYNDSFGHKAGDRILQCVAKTLEDGAGEKGIACRYGGEEFSIILPGFCEGETITMAEKLRAGVENEKVAIEGVDRGVTISMGAVVWNREWTVNQFIEQADTALYKSKANGRNKVTFTRPQQ